MVDNFYFIPLVKGARGMLIPHDLTSIELLHRKQSQ